MARVGIGQMSDRREDLTTASVKCYIYNSRTNVPTDPIIIPTVPVVDTGAIPTVIVPTVPTTPTIETPTPPIIPTTPIETPTIPTVPVVVPPTIPTPILQDSLHKTLALTFENLSDIATHFMTQYDLVATFVSKSPLKLGEVATLTLEIKDKDGNLYSGLLPFSFTILSTNDSVQADISNIQMINN